ncbi:MAG: choice-of-anchor I family protein [Opitutaceae bacterium]
MTHPLKVSLLTLSLGIIAHSGYSQISINPISSIRNGTAEEVFDGSAAEIVQYDYLTQQMYVVNGSADSIDIFDISAPESPVLVRSVDLSAYGNPNSVSVNPNKNADEVAVAVGADDADQRGTVVFLNKSGDFIDAVQVGYLPDMLTYDSKGKHVVVANEGEPTADYTFDGEGSVSIIEVRENGYHVTEVSLAGIEAADLNGARISGPEGTTIAQDLEPEYIAIDSKDHFAYVACQENNALLKIDLKRKQVEAVYGLGYKNHAELGNALDASDKDDAVRIANWPVKGLFMPDSIAAYEVGKTTYIVTANEGDGREYEFENSEGDDEISFIDESRVKDLDLDPSAFPLGDELKEDENLGRLTVLTTQGDLDGDGDFDELYSFGARSFSIFSDEGALVFDSGDFIETYLAENFPDDFNSDNDENDTADSRSDAKGPEPEALTIGEIDGRSYAFVGLERMGGIMTFDITDPTAVSFVDYFNNRDFAGDAEDGTAGDLGPEGLEFIPANQSPNGRPLLLVAYEVSGTTTVYEILADL